MPTCIQRLCCSDIACPHVPQNRPTNLLYYFYSFFVQMGGFVGGGRRCCYLCEFCWWRWDGSLNSRATSLTTFLLFRWLLIVPAQLHSALLLLLCHMPLMYHIIDPQICCIIFIPFSSRRGDLLGEGGAGVVRVNFVGGAGCGESCGLFGWGWQNRARILSIYPGRESSTHHPPS